MNKERVAVYIDGGNTYRRLKGLDIPKEGTKFDFSDFINHLVGDRELISKRYYVGVVRNITNTAKEEGMVKSQQKFLDGLRNDGFEVKTDKIMYDNGKIREKGVDVKMSLDIAIGGFDNLYDTAIIISSDTDMIPVIKYVKNIKNKKVEYIGFGDTPSFGMIKETTLSRIFSNLDLVSFEKLK